MKHLSFTHSQRKFLKIFSGRGRRPKQNYFATGCSAKFRINFEHRGGECGGPYLKISTFKPEHNHEVYLCKLTNLKEKLRNIEKLFRTSTTKRLSK